MKVSHIYAGNPLDRGDHERRDEQLMAEYASATSSKFLPLMDLSVLVSGDQQERLGWLGVDDVRRLGADGRTLFLGLLEGAACFVVDVTGQAEAVQNLRAGDGYQFVDGRTVTQFLSAADSGIVAQARAQVSWHARTGFCSACGHETFVKRGGQVRQCSNCEIEHYPRTDPVVITVVSDGERALLGQSRGRLSRTRTYSALAGFVDQGESIEEAVAREVMEEAGISVKNVRYHSSQPWPFPHSLMIGCHADAASTDIHIDEGEMLDVRWFQRDEVLAALQGATETLVVPGFIAIAHHLIKAWANKETG